MKPWKRIEPTAMVNASRRGITVKSFQLPDGSLQQFEIFDRDGLQHAACIAITTDGKVLIAEQFRAGPEAIMQELPGGSVDEGEDPQTAVLRELQEETGYMPGKVEYLGKVYKDAYMNGTWHYYLVTGCELSSHAQNLDIDERINVRTITIDELLDNARKARMTDVEAVFLAYEKLLDLK